MVFLIQLCVSYLFLSIICKRTESWKSHDVQADFWSQTLIYFPVENLTLAHKSRRVVNFKKEKEKGKRDISSKWLMGKKVKIKKLNEKSPAINFMKINEINLWDANESWEI
jgi:hypothetical protein